MSASRWTIEAPVRPRRMLAHAVGPSEETKDLLSDRELVKDLADGVYVAHVECQQHSPGRSTVRAFRALMESGRAHVINAAVPSLPPVTDDLADNTLVNMSLGWVNNSGSEGGLRPGGICVGRVVNSDTYGHVILFFPDVAFSAAQDAYPEMIQHGQQATIAWSSVWDEGLTPVGLNRRKSGAGTPINTWRNQGVTGVPVTVEELIKGKAGSGDHGHEDDEDS